MRGKPNLHPEVVFLLNGDRLQPRLAHEESEGGGDPNGGGYAPPTFRGLCTRTHTYAVALDGRWLLFDNIKDPYQQKNLIDDSAHQTLIHHFDEQISAWLKEASDPFPYQEAIQKRSTEPV